MSDRIAQERTRLTTQFDAIGEALAALGHRADGGASASRPAAGGRAKREAVTLAILEALKTMGPIKPGELARVSGVKPTTVSTALDNGGRNRSRCRALTTKSRRNWRDGGRIQRHESRWHAARFSAMRSPLI